MVGMTDVVRGPCRVQAKGCRGPERSCNNDHSAWSWRKASKPGVLDADGPNKKDYNGVETSWPASGDTEEERVDICQCGACVRLACGAPRHLKRVAAKMESGAAPHETEVPFAGELDAGPFDSSAWNGMGVRTATAQ